MYDRFSTRATRDGAMQPHDTVEVRNRYDGRWSQGFQVVEECPSGYRLRRVSDGSVLPKEFHAEDVRVLEA
jgi:hypothetical protein